MDYKSLMGFNKKKKVVKETPETPKPQVNKVLESIKEEFGYKDILKEVGAAPTYKKHIKSIDKYRDQVGRQVLKFYELLRKKGLDDAADELLDNYKNNIIKFGKDLKQLVRKII